MAALKQIALILVGYCLAAVITGFVVAACVHFDNREYGEGARQGFFGFAVMVSFFVAVFAAMPAAGTVALGEYKAWRMWWYYALAGSLIGCVLGYSFRPPAFFPWLGLGFGPVSGLIFWAIAGRNAGLESVNGRRIVVAVFALIFVITLLMWTPILFGVVR